MEEGNGGPPSHAPNSTTCVGAIETAQEFGKCLYVKAWNLGWDNAATTVVIGDGAVWIWNLADQHFPGAMQIVDLYRARKLYHQTINDCAADH